MTDKGKSGVRLAECCLKTSDCNLSIFKVRKQKAYLKCYFVFISYFKVSAEGFYSLKQKHFREPDGEEGQEI